MVGALLKIICISIGIYFFVSIFKKIKNMNKGKRKWYKIWWVWIIILVLLAIISNLTDNACGCTDNEIAQIQSTMMKSRAEAIEYCCMLRNIKY